SIAGNKPPLEVGKNAYRSKGCAQCHSIDGTKNTGPTWKDMFGHAVEFTDGTSHDEAFMSDPAKFAEYVRESVKTPAAKIVKGYPNSMTLFDLTEKQMHGVIQYMMSLSDKAPPPEAMPAGDKPTDKPAEPAPATAPSEK